MSQPAVIRKPSASEGETAPSEKTFSLEWLLAPVTKQEFLEKYFEKQTLVVRHKDKDYFRGLFSLDEVDRVLTTLDRRYPDIILKNAAKEITSADYTIDDDKLDVAKIYQLFQEGSTITLAFLDAVVPTLTNFCRNLENEFSCPFQTNIYMTPPGAQGAKSHYDTHDVFVLQVAGTKKWNIYGTPVELPLPGQDYDAEIHARGDVTMEFTLEEGDVAYVPRGVMHDAHSTETVSLHITTGMLRYTWTDLMLEALAGVALKDGAFRKALPPGFARGDFDKAKAREMMRELFERAAESAEFDAALGNFVEEFTSACPPLLQGQMAQMAGLARLTPQSVAGARKGSVARLRDAGEALKVECYGRQITFPAPAREAVRYALGHARFVVGELPGELDDASKVTLVRRLIREGLVMALPDA
ncbi:MAG TPA: cupin domain-containing protein [Candidatus Acidoferrales bacterium]|nr:cupin domain-containing protein [Candidatus Acidoferrales bacterium]